MLDGVVGNSIFTTGGSEIWTEIKNGIATQYKQGPSRKYFNGRENVRTEGVLHELEKWVRDDELIFFFRKFGYLLKDEVALAYSAKYKGKV